MPGRPHRADQMTEIKWVTAQGKRYRYHQAQDN